MQTNELKLALKEWAVTQRALLEGHQIVLLRKGGLVEETGDFDLRAREFLVFPTYIHETERGGDVQPCFRQWLREEEERRPPTDTLRIEAAASVTDIVRVDDRAKLIRLTPTHLWTEEFINARYDWEPYKPVFALIVRAYKLPEPVEIPMRREYGGCTSWVTLDAPILTEGAMPAVGDAFFERRRELTKRVLS